MLSLAAPWALLGLLTLPVIVWLHFRRRPARRVTVPSLAPWLSLMAAEPRPRRAPPRSWRLLAQLAAAACLSVALARPSWPGPAAAAESRAVLLDTSTSMAAAGTWPAALERARALILATRGEVTLLTLGPRPRVLVARDAGGQAALAALSGLRPGGVGADLDAALALARARAPEAERVIVSDGRLEPPGPAAPGARWERVGTPADNLAVVAAGTRSLAGRPRLFARVANLGRQPATVPLTLSVDGRPLDRRSLALAAGATEEAVWALPPGAAQAELRLATADALPEDDFALLPLAAPERRLQLVGESPALARALSALPGHRLQRAGLGSYRADGSVDVSVFVGALPATLPAGGVLVFNPAPGGPLGAGQARTKLVLDTLGDDPLPRGLDLSGVELAGLTSLAPEAGLEPLVDSLGRTLVYGGRLGASHVLAFPFDPDAGDLAERVAFPVLVARAVERVATSWPAAPLPAGAAISLPALAGAVVVAPDGRRLPAGAIFDETAQPGVYAWRPPPDAGVAARPFAVAAGDPVESDLRAARLEPPGAGPGEAGAGRVEAWPWLLALGLACVLAEGLLRAGPPRVRPRGER